jgi:integral membrane protein (TIGR01906 family)
LKIVDLVTKWIFILCLPVLLLSSSLAWGFNSRWLYNYGFQKYHVSEQTGFSPDELDKAAKGLIDYFNSSDEYVNIVLIQNGEPVDLFTKEEQIHFNDVKRLIKLDYQVLITSLILVLIYSLFVVFWRRGKYGKELGKNLILGCGLSIIIILILGIASLFNFDQLFFKFHYLVFTNQYWSASGYMLLLFPGGFWYDAAFFCIAFMASLAVTLGVTSILAVRVTKRNL